MISFKVFLDLSIQLAIEPVQSSKRHRSRLFFSALDPYLDNAGCLDVLLARTGATGSFFDALLDKAGGAGGATRGAFLLALGAGAAFLAGAFLIAAGLGALGTLPSFFGAAFFAI
jgi:hypothetical protein